MRHGRLLRMEVATVSRNPRLMQDWYHAGSPNGGPRQKVWVDRVNSRDARHQEDADNH